VLSASAAAMATSVRVMGDCDDILRTPFLSRMLMCRPMAFAIQGLCQSQKTARNCAAQVKLARFPSQELVGIAKLQLGTFATLGASKRQLVREGV
jgi:hypothetical protein